MANKQVPSKEKPPREYASPMSGYVKHQVPSDWSTHETVIGYPDDKVAENYGIKEILEVVSLFEDASIPCCITGVMALQYYGVPLITDPDWRICVPSACALKAEEIIRGDSDKYMPFRANICWNPAEAIYKFPRFKHTGLQLFFSLVPSEAICFSFDEQDAIVRGRTGIPLPGLRAFVQSLVDAKNHVYLEYVIDGMNLSEEWGDAVGLKFGDEVLPQGALTRREWWRSSVTSKQRRLSGKLNPKYYATNYRLHREKYDPAINSWL